MIIDRLNNSKFYYNLGLRFEKAFKYLEQTNLQDIECGIHHIEDHCIYVSIMEYTTKVEEECLWEAHRKYIDIQYIISGKEKMGYVNVDKIKTTIEYNNETDIMFGETKGEFLIVEQGSFIIFTPYDGHMPSVMVNEGETIKKAVIKILLD